jgi:C-terminal processing protease CtpA/Prc
VSGSIVDHGVDPVISELIPGTWAQRSDVLLVGDVVVGINGVSTATMTEKVLAQMLERSDRVQLEVRYPLPPRSPSRSKFRSKMIQVTLNKENGSFGMVIRGGDHEIGRRRRPFTIINLTPGGPTYADGTVRVNDRLRSVNGVELKDLKLPELQSLLYRQVSVLLPLARQRSCR